MEKPKRGHCCGQNTANEIKEFLAIQNTEFKFMRLTVWHLWHATSTDQFGNDGQQRYQIANANEFTVEKCDARENVGRNIEIILSMAAQRWRCDRIQ